MPSLPRSFFLMPRSAHAALIILFAGSASIASAQASTALPSPPTGASRAEVTATVATLRRIADSTSLHADDRARARRFADRLSRRLSEGDFRPGERLVLRVVGDPSLDDTLTVSPERTVRLRGLPDVSLAGALRSEAEVRLREHIARFVREPQVRVEPLLRVAVLGSVTRPGYYLMGPHIPLSDALMIAGGPLATANLPQLRVMRGEAELYSETDARVAMGQGLSLEQLDIQPGDEIVVPERSRRELSSYLGIVSALLGAAMTITLIRNSRNP